MNSPLVCPECHASLKKINYQIWGTKRFDGKTASYQEDENLGETDMEFTCPNCSAELDPDPIIES